MTFKEKYRLDHPNSEFNFLNCPSSHGYEDDETIDLCNEWSTCSDCWDREMPEENKEEEKEMITATVPKKQPVTRILNKHCPDLVECGVAATKGCVECEYYKVDFKRNSIAVKDESVIKDSGERTTFASGAQRDMHGGKGRMDLLPWAAIMEVSKHCENGANKYGEHNVDLGIPTSSLCDSAARHLAKYLDGWTDEPHLVAAAWNLLWAIQMEVKNKEMVNTPWKPENKPEASV